MSSTEASDDDDDPRRLLRRLRRRRIVGEGAGADAIFEWPFMMAARQVA